MSPFYLSLLLLLHLSNSLTFNCAFSTPTPSPAAATSTPSPSPSTATTTIHIPTLNSAPSPSTTTTHIPTPKITPSPAPSSITTPIPSPTPTHIPPSTVTNTTTSINIPTAIQIHNLTTHIPTLNNSASASPPLQQRRIHRQQLNNIIDALIGAGDFKRWADILSVADPSSLPLSATFFVPTDDSRSPISTIINVDPFIFPYHIIPQRLCFADLRQLKLYSRLPTLLASNSILVTNNSVSNYTLDDSLLSHPDLFTSGTFAVHGMESLLDYTVYGVAKPKASQPEVLSQPPPAMFEPVGEVTDDNLEVDAACLCTEIWPVFLVFCAVLASKFQRMSLGR